MKAPPASLLLPFETLLNRCISQDMRLAEDVARHAGKTLLLEITGPPIKIVIRFYPSSVALSFAQDSDGEHTGSRYNRKTGSDIGDDSEYTGAESAPENSAPNGMIKGSALAMLRLMLESNDAHGLVNPAIQVSGDSEFVEAVHGLFKDMEIDWQEPLSRVIGDIPTQGIDRLLSDLGAFARNTAESVRRNIDEYLHEESHVVPPVNQIEMFDQDLDVLRLRLDRLQARVERLSNRLAGKTA